jgi:hypothetical protein
MAKMNDLTVIIDRVRSSETQKARAAIEEVLEILEPLRKRGLRVRVTRSHRTVKEDKAWKAKI